MSEKPTLREALATALLLGSWLGIGGGILEVGVQLWYQQSGMSMKIGRAAVWMVPLTDWVLAAVPAAFMGLARWRWPERVSLRMVVAVPLTLVIFGWLLQFLSVHWLAWLILALGVAVQLSRFLSTARFVRFCKLSLIPLLLIPAVTAYRSSVQAEAAEREALARLPEASPAAVNVILIVLDTVRAENTSLQGYDRPTTPRLQRLALQGTRYERAIAPSSWTLPTHASLFTGRWPHELSTDWGRTLDATYPTLAGFLQGKGYRTAGFVGNTVYAYGQTGLGRGFIRYEDFPVCVGEALRCSALGNFLTDNYATRLVTGFYDELGRVDAATVNRRCLTWLDEQEHGPFFLFLNYFDAHHPYMPPAEFAARFGSDPSVAQSYLYTRWWFTDKIGLSPEQIQQARNAYDAGIAYCDHQVGQLLDALETRGLLNNTLIVITSDHGEQLGEHGLFTHGNSVYSQVIHVPLLLVYPPRVPAGQMRSAPVSLRDLPATILDLLELDDHPFPGSSLALDWSMDDDLRSPVVRPILAEVSGNIIYHTDHGRSPVFRGPVRSVLLNGMHYILNGDGQEELYDFFADPGEAKDLADTVDLTPFRHQLDALSPPLGGG